MRTNLFLYATILVHALSAFAALGDPFSLRIYTPVDSDYYIKTLREDWTIANYDKAHFADLKDAEKGIPNHKKAKYSVAGVIDWTKLLSEATPVQKRAFWVGRGDPNAAPRDLLKCTVSPRRWQDEDMWLYLGPQWSFTDIGGCDTLQVGWLKCTKTGDIKKGFAWDDEYFVKPKDSEFPYNKGCGKN